MPPRNQYTITSAGYAALEHSALHMVTDYSVSDEVAAHLRADARHAIDRSDSASPARREDLRDYAERTRVRLLAAGRIVEANAIAFALIARGRKIK